MFLWYGNERGFVLQARTMLEVQQNTSLIPENLRSSSLAPHDFRCTRWAFAPSALRRHPQADPLTPLSDPRQYAPPPITQNLDKSSLSSFNKACVDRLEELGKTEFVYRDEHATKPATIGIVVGSSPVAMLAWIGKKFLRWSDPSTRPTSTQILVDITLYYLTRILPTSLTHYWSNPPLRYAVPASKPDFAAIKGTNKPIGYSLCRYEIAPSLPEWAEGIVDLVWSRRYEKVGFSLCSRSEPNLESKARSNRYDGSDAAHVAVGK